VPSLFPATQETPAALPAENRQVQFGRSWRFDFTKGEFVLTPTGVVAQNAGAEAWLEWCQKAVMTTRYRHLVYSRLYGQEFEDLIGRHLSRGANESEIKRMVTECLMLDPRTASVSNFTFAWDGDQVTFTCDLANVLGEGGTLSGSVVIS
jgi:hypothetical protein